MTLTLKMKNPATEWREARLLYPLYSALAREFVIELPPCDELESGLVDPPSEALELARQWFLAMDEKIQVHQLRQFLQTTSLTSEEALQILLEHHLYRPARLDSDRDKIDFLLVQYFSHCAPSRLEDADVDLAYVAQTLEPVLGNIDLTVPSWLQPLDDFIQAADSCRSLNELLTSSTLEKGRKLKISVEADYFEPIAMVAFTRFSFLMRRVFFRLMHNDLNTILDGLRELEGRGVNTLDCRSAQFSADEPVARLRLICQSWKVMFHAEYSSGSPLRMLVDLRNVMDAALARTNKKTASQPAKKRSGGRAKAAAAGAQATPAESGRLEFEVKSVPEWDEEASASQQGSDHHDSDHHNLDHKDSHKQHSDDDDKV